MAGTTDELKDLASLLREGLITRAQFEQERDALFARRSTPPTSSTLSQSSPSLGESIGAYSITGNLGRGGMGVVYRGKHRTPAIANRHGGEVAVKLLHAQYAQDTGFRDRFEREASMGLKLDHPNIVKVHDLVIDGGNLALVMELAQGRPLSEVIGKETGPIPWERAWPMFKQLLDAVKYAHTHNVVHRDLKPENVIVSSKGQLKVLDFGIAKDLEGGKTKTGTGMGTVDYMAPEQYTDAKNVDQRADIYALGMTLYEMLAGRLPWPAGDTEWNVMNRKAKGELPPPTDFYPEIPPGVVKVIRAATTVKPAERIQSVDGFIAALQGEDAAIEQSGEWEAETPTDAGVAPPASVDSEEADRVFDAMMQEAKASEAEKKPLSWWSGPATFFVIYVLLTLLWYNSMSLEAPLVWLGGVLGCLHSTGNSASEQVKETQTGFGLRAALVFGIGIWISWLLVDNLDDLSYLNWAVNEAGGFDTWAAADWQRLEFAHFAIWTIGGLSACFWVSKIRSWPPVSSWKWSPVPFVLLMTGMAFLAYFARSLDVISGGFFSFGAVAALVYGLKQQRKHHGSAWRIPPETNGGQRFKAALTVAVASLLFLGIAACFIVREIEIKGFYEEGLIEIFANGPGFWIFASGAFYTLYWARLVHPNSEIGASTQEIEDAPS